MKVCDLDYKQALRRHPDEVEAIVAKLRKGRSKHKQADPADLKWSYECAVLIEGDHSFGALISGKSAQRQADFDALSIEDKVADQVRRTTTSLEARIGRWWYGLKIENPPVIAEAARANFEQQARERQEWEALPVEERERQTQASIDQFVQGGGTVIQFDSFPPGVSFGEFPAGASPEQIAKTLGFPPESEVLTDVEIRAIEKVLTEHEDLRQMAQRRGVSSDDIHKLCQMALQSAEPFLPIPK